MYQILLEIPRPGSPVAYALNKQSLNALIIASLDTASVSKDAVLHALEDTNADAVIDAVDAAADVAVAVFTL